MDIIVKKKNRNLMPRRKRMDRKSRIQSATEWVKKYEGKNMIASYAKWFGVDLICAMTELEMLGLTFSDKRKTQIKKAEENRKHQRKILKEKRKQKNKCSDDDFESNEIFSFIAGYTDGGVPFGIAYEEENREELELNNISKRTFVIEDDKLPF
jgi:hypothetical protein